MGRLECQWTYKNTILFIPYHSDQKIVLSVERVKNRSNMVWDFQIFLERKIENEQRRNSCGVLLALPVGSHFYKQKKFAGMQRYGIWKSLKFRKKD